MEGTARVEAITQTTIRDVSGDFMQVNGKCPQQCLATMKALPSPQKVRPIPGEGGLLNARDELPATTVEWRFRTEVE